MKKAQCEAVVDVPTSDGTGWRKGRRCPKDGHAYLKMSTRNLRKTWLCWVHLQAAVTARRIPLKIWREP